MADNDDKNLETRETNDVDESKTQDETVATDSKSTETSETSTQTGTDSDESSSFEKRFTQFKGDTLEEYLKNLEQGYGNSSQEALRLKKQLDELRGEKLSAVANSDKDVTDESKGKQKAASTTDLWVEQEMKRRHVEQYNKFADAHPEVNEDDDLFSKLDEETGRYMNYVLATEKRVPDLAESLEFAWMRVGPKGDHGTKEEQVASAVKNAGSAQKTKGTVKDDKRPEFTDKQIEAAKRIDPSLRDKSRSEIEELLSKYTK